MTVNSFAEQLLMEGLCPDMQELIAYLLEASRQGHLCIQFFNGQPSPDPAELFDELAPSSEHLYQQFEQLDLGEEHPFLIKHKNSLFLRKYWYYREQILTKFHEHCQRGVLEKIKPSLAPSLLPEQRLFVEQASQQSLSILTGGPGTGKTFTVGGWLESLFKELSHPIRIALVAPTGKAAARLLESLQKQTLPRQLLECCEVQTLHRLLGVMPTRKGPAFHEQRPLPFQVVVVDESSMIDARLMAYLACALQPHSRIALVGDPDQLPPVQSGQVFPDLVEIFKEQAIALKQCMRTDNLSLQSLAEQVRLGSTGSVLSLLDEHSLCRSLPDPQQLLREAHQRGWGKSLSFAEAKQRFQDVRILSPLRKGEWGVERLNTLLLQSLFHPGIYIPIMIVQNDPKMQLYNGDTAIIEAKSLPLRHFDNNVQLEDGRVVPAVILPQFELAYCLSVHKSQGSEYTAVQALFPPGSEAFGRELFYTAITRAKKKVEIYGDKKTLHKLLERSSRRVTGLISE